MCPVAIANPRSPGCLPIGSDFSRQIQVAQPTSAVVKKCQRMLVVAILRLRTGGGSAIYKQNSCRHLAEHGCDRRIYRSTVAARQIGFPIQRRILMRSDTCWLFQPYTNADSGVWPWPIPIHCYKWPGLGPVLLCGYLAQLQDRRVLRRLVPARIESLPLPFSRI